MNKNLFATLLVSCTLLACTDTPSADYHTVPLAQEINLTGDKVFTLNNHTPIVYEGGEAMLRNAQLLSEYIGEKTGLNLQTTAEPQTGAITLAIAPGENAEGYSLTVTAEGVNITGASEAGVFYGIQTLRKALPITDAKSIKLPAVTINDYPRFGYRGAHLDVSRHFFSVDSVKRFIDILALHHINRFHWHLTDDQGWRLEIKQYPLLTEKGAWRKFNNHDRDCMKYAVEQDNPDYEIPTDKMQIVEGDTLYGGFYTQEDVRK